jgi:hypothetical protein
MITELKTCKTCGESLPLSNFHIHTKRENGDIYRIHCNDCRSKARKTNYDADYNANSMLKKLYGITLGDYDQMVEKQNGKCAICESTEPKSNGARFAVDHDHKTGKVRGLLCGSCNTGIGKLGDDIALLTSAIEYLKDHSNV